MSTTISDSNFGRLAYIPEVTFGVTPTTPTLQTARFTSSDLGSQKETALSDEIRADRMVSTVAEVSATSGGGVNFELSLGTFDTFLEAALCGTYTTALAAAGVATITGNKFSLTAGFSAAAVGQWVFAAGFTNAVNNGWFRVTAVTANDITVDGTLTIESATGAKTVKGKMLRNGVVKRSFTFEEAMLDINQFFLFKGLRLGTMSLDVKAGSIVTGAFGFQGTVGANAQTTAATAVTAATTSQVINATSNVGAVLEATTYTALTTAIQSFNLNLDNALRNQMAVGSKYPAGIGYGRQKITGSLNAYFQSAALYTKFIGHTSSALSFAFTDLAGNGLRITLPKVFFESSNPDIGGIDQDVMENIDWTAVMDTTTACQIQIDVIA